MIEALERENEQLKMTLESEGKISDSSLLSKDFMDTVNDKIESWKVQSKPSTSRGSTVDFAQALIEKKEGELEAAQKRIGELESEVGQLSVDKDGLSVSALSKVCHPICGLDRRGRLNRRGSGSGMPRSRPSRRSWRRGWRRWRRRVGWRRPCAPRRPVSPSESPGQKHKRCRCRWGRGGAAGGGGGGGEGGEGGEGRGGGGEGGCGGRSGPDVPIARSHAAV